MPTGFFFLPKPQIWSLLVTIILFLHFNSCGKHERYHLPTTTILKIDFSNKEWIDDFITT